MITDYANPFVRQRVLAHIMKFTDMENPVEFIMQLPEVKDAESVYYGIVRHARNDGFFKTVKDKRAFIYDTLQFMPGDKELEDKVVTVSYEHLLANEAEAIVNDYKAYMNAKERYELMIDKARKVIDIAEKYCITI